ncbi:LOW QUALITY PROTEIN: Eukaryotic/viral aspartic protease [Phytophthora megakarya]|uniref:Eukaryotic/viral aspartic protease n=1 Tax=Phytophthora megakarya TaxID=4795 RepID=A0A225UZH9_9STRA|nr:LOW QUALITY PROTEIN: Eukaryotic/viral aspartic protease [Phytophthora megakarya]
MPESVKPSTNSLAFSGRRGREVKWPEDREMGFVNTTEIVEGNDRSLGENEADELDVGEYDGGFGFKPGTKRDIVPKPHSDYSCCQRLGWWSSQRYDKRKRMRAVVVGAIDDTRTRILLDTGANVSVISAEHAKRRRLREVFDHGRSLEVRGINPGVLETRRRALVKITLGWERVYEFEMWIMEHSAGVDVVLGTNFMIPAGVRLDLFHGTARLPDEVTVPLVKPAVAADDKLYGVQVVGGPTEDLRVARVPTASEKTLTCDTRVMDKENQTNGTDSDGNPQGQACVGPPDERVGWDGTALQALFCGPVDT